MKGFHLGVAGHVVNILPPTSAVAATSSDYFHLKEAGHVDIVILTGTVTNATTVTVYESQTSGGTTQTAITFDYYECTAGTDTWSAKTSATAGGVSLTTGNDRAMVISIDASQLTDGYPYVMAQFSTAAACKISANAVLSDLRYSTEVNLSAID